MRDDSRRAQLEAAIAVSPFSLWCGVRLETFERGRVTVSLDVRTDLLQHHGFVHGAIVGFLADSVCSWAAASAVGDVVTSEYKINFLAPAVGERLEATGEVVKATARQVVTRADVFALRAGERKLIAVALATIARVEGRSGA